MTDVSNITSSPLILLQAEVKKLNEQLSNQTKGIEGLLSQLDACKQTINELMNTNLVLRTTVNMRDKEIKAANEYIDAHKAELENVRQQLIQASKPEFRGLENAVDQE